jgi:hypothetical protein
MSSSGTSGNQSTVIQQEPYAPSQPALNQILSEASTIYGQGPQYVAPSATTLEGIAQQEALARQGYTQIANTLSGQYSNPFLSPIIQQAAQDVYSGVASQFSGAGRTPTSPMAQQEVISQVAAKALPYAFQEYGSERQRQLSAAQALPSLTSVGQTLEGYEQQRIAAPLTSLTNYANIVNPIARGGQVSTTLPPAPNRLGMALGGLTAGGAILSQGGMFGGGTNPYILGGGFGGGVNPSQFYGGFGLI